MTRAALILFGLFAAMVFMLPMLTALGSRFGVWAVMVEVLPL